MLIFVINSSIMTYAGTDHSRSLATVPFYQPDNGAARGLYCIAPAFQIPFSEYHATLK